jgi:phospholipid/cholesterol/gamma-HCH transport system substrate-binding protein
LALKQWVTPVRVGVFVVGALASFAVFLQIVSTSGSSVGESILVHAYFDDVLGLEQKSPVQVAGIDIGAIDGIVLDQERGKAKLSLRIRKGVKLYKNARISKISISLLGDFKLAVNPGGPPSPELVDGDFIDDVVSASDTEQIIAEVRKMSEAVSKLVAGTEGQPSPLEKIVYDVQSSAAAARQVIETVNQNIGGNVEKLDRILSNIDAFTKDLKNISDGKDTDIDAITKDAREIARALRVTSQGLEQIIAGQNQGELQESVKSLRQTLDTMNRALENVASIADKVDKGEGTIGALVNERQIHDDVAEAVEGAGELINGVSRLQTWVNLRSEFQFRAGAAKNYLQIQLRPKEDKYYIIEVVDDPRGVRETVIEDVETTSPESGRDFQYRERRTTTVDGLKFSIQFAKRYYWLALRFGIIENTGGVGANAFFFDDRLELLLDINQFGEETRRPRFKALAAMEVVPHVYLTGGVDDFLNPGTTDFFLGGGVRFNDEDLKYLLFSIGGIPTGN